MKSVYYPATERGHANHGWLDSYHSFSFANFYDPSRIHFGALRVLNDDTVKPGFGFSRHPHDNMEIVSIPLFGDLEHKDSTGRTEIIRQNDVQIMSAGSGISHSEMNANKDKEVKFLQIWVFPLKRDIEPRYQQKTFDPEKRMNRIQTVVAPDQADAIEINQNAWFSLLKAAPGFETSYQVKKEGNGVYVFMIDGAATVNGIALGKRDAAGIWEAGQLDITVSSASELLLIDVPMKLEGLS